MSLDWDLYRALYAESDCPTWQAESHPAVPALAQRLGVAPNTVWRRLLEWRRIGFLRGHAFLPNPLLLGIDLELSLVQLTDSTSRMEFLDALELIDGVILAETNFSTPVALFMVADRSASGARRRAVISGLPGVVQVSRVLRAWLPTPSRPLSYDDMRLIAALRASPNAPFSRLAKELGWSDRTLSRRFQTLKRAHAMLTVQIEEFSNFPHTVAILDLRVDSVGDSRAIAARIARDFGGILELPALSRPPFSPHHQLYYMTECSHISQTEELEAKLLKYSGVSGVAARFPGVQRFYSTWIDDRIDQFLRAPQ